MSKKNWKPYTEKQEKFGTSLIRKVGKWQVWVYEKTNGKLWGKFLGAEVAIFTIIGRKSGEARKTPLVFAQDNGSIIVAASKGGMSGFPLWYLNMKANPEVWVQIKSNKRLLTAREASEEEREILWPKLDAVYDGYAEYRERVAAKGERYIPIMVLEEPA